MIYSVNRNVLRLPRVYNLGCYTPNERMLINFRNTLDKLRNISIINFVVNGPIEFFYHDWNGLEDLYLL